MTVVSNDRRRTYAGNGVATSFTGPKATLASHVTVWLIDNATGDTTSVSTGSYTLSGVGGRRQTTVVMNSAPASGKTLLILRTVPFEQDSDISNQGAYLPEVVELAMDNIVRQTQQLADMVAFSIRFPDTMASFNPIVAGPYTPGNPLLIGSDGMSIAVGDPVSPGDLLLRGDLASSASGKGGSLVKLKDSAGLFSDDDVEDALQEIGGNSAVESIKRSMRDGGTVKIVCLGDSITYGQLDGGGVATTPWPARLQSLLRQYYSNNNITVINAGVSGNTVEAMINRFASDVRAQNPDLIVFNGGTNDSREDNGVSLDTYRANCLEILRLCKPTPVVVVGITPRFKEQASNNGEGVVHFYRETLRRLAQVRGIPYVDTFTKINSLYKSRAWAAGLFSSDGSHYSEEGYRYLGDFIFASAFANADLFMKPGQFRDMRGGWIITDAASSSWGVLGVQDSNAIILSASSVRMYLFLDDWQECNLCLHVTLDRVNGSNQTITVSNSSVSGGGGVVPLSPNAAGGVNFFVNDYIVPIGRLRPGINNLGFSTSTSARINGVSVLPIGEPNYLPSFNAVSNENRALQFWGSTRYQMSTHSFQVLRPGILTVSNGGSGYIEPYFLLVPDAISAVSRWRFRATIRPNASFYLGQQSDGDGNYSYVYRVLFDGTNCIVSVRDRTGALRVGATVALAVSASGTEIMVDLKSQSTGWTLWVNTTPIFSDAVPLGVGPVFVSASTTDRSYWNPPIKKGPQVSDTGTIIGEEWIAFSPSAPVKHLIDKSAADRTLTYT